MALGPLAAGVVSLAAVVTTPSSPCALRARHPRTISRLPPRPRAALLASAGGAGDFGSMVREDPLVKEKVLTSSTLDLLRDGASLDSLPCKGNPNKCLSVAAGHTCEVIERLDRLRRVRVAFFLALWYALSVGFQVVNKKLCLVLPLPWTIAAGVTAVGAALVLGAWGLGLRPAPRLRPGPSLNTLIVLGVLHGIGQLAGSIGTYAGSVSFAQVVKAAGPVWTVLLSALVLSERVSAGVALSLVPIIAGVAVSTLQELSFAWAALLGAVVSDVAFALRNVVSKRSMASAPPPGEKLSPANLFGVLTVVATAFLVPLAAAREWRVIPSAWAAATAQTPAHALLAQLLLAGAFFYGYSEVAMQALSNISPITHAIANTVRRVVIMVVSAAVFATPMTQVGKAGSSLAIAGSYLYSLAKNREKTRAASIELERRVAAMALQPTPDAAVPCLYAGVHTFDDWWRSPHSYEFEI